MSKMTRGDIEHYVALLCAKGFLEEVRCEDEVIRYRPKKLRSLIFRCMDCNFLTTDIIESIKHGEKLNHYSDSNIYDPKQRKALLQEIFDEERQAV